MTCQHCFSADVPMLLGSYCGFCSHLVTQKDLDVWHAEMVAPRRALEEERFDLALREGGG